MKPHPVLRPALPAGAGDGPRPRVSGSAEEVVGKRRKDLE